MKVCHMTSAHGAEDTRIFHKECVSLAKSGYDVYLVERGASYDKKGVHIVGVGEISGGRIKRILLGAKAVYRTALKIDADLYHFHDPELLPYALKLKRKGKKVIFDSHERYPEQIRCKHYLPKILRNTVAAFYGMYENRILKKIDGVIFPCTMNGKNPFDGLCCRAVIVPNYAILSEFPSMDNRMQKKSQVCYVGGLTEARGIRVNILAAYKSGVTLALGGAFDSADFERNVRLMPEFSCVDYKGVLDRKGVADLLSESLAGLCVLQDQGQYLKIDTFGIKVYEYMSSGIPVILSHSNYNDRMIEKYRMGICVDPTDADDLAKAISYIADHPKEAAEMGQNGLRAVKEEFNWGTAEKTLLALYEDILK